MNAKRPQQTSYLIDDHETQSASSLELRRTEMFALQSIHSDIKSRR